MEYLKKWYNNLASRPSLTIERSVKVSGICKKHLGPRLEYALIELSISPSNVLNIEFSKKLLDLDDNSKVLVDEAIFGVLDILLLSKLIPLKDIKIVVLNADIHPVDSNKSAFRKAGRDAGHKIIKAFEI